MESLEQLLIVITYAVLAGSLSAILVWSTPWLAFWNSVLPRIRIDTAEFVRELVTCPVCTGFWIGLIYGSLAPTTNAAIALGVAGLASVWARVAYNILDWIPDSD